jgi:hypothetical protein
MTMARPGNTKTVETLTHDEARRKNIPTAEYQSVLPTEQQQPKQIRYPRPDAAELGEEKSARNRDLDPQLVWRGKDEQDWSDLVVSAPPLYIQEKVHPKVLIDDLLRSTKERKHEAGQITADLFADFNGIPKGADKTDFYQHDQNWTNRMILGDSLQVMASLAEREGLRGKVQCIYLDPPYGIKFNSNFQWSTTSRDVKDGNASHITREPEQVKAFRDTWRDGIHSYLTYLRDRLTVARDLLTESGSIFVQIGDENVHRVRAVMDEVFGGETLHPDVHRPRRPRPRPDLRFRHHRHRRRAMGPPLDHHRHLARCTRAGPRPHHGRPLSVLPAGRFPRGPARSRKPKSPAARRARSRCSGNLRHGFVYERVPHITLKSIANNAEIDVIWEQWQAKLEPLRESLNAALNKTWQEWEIPRDADPGWPDTAKKLHADWWQARIARQKEIDASIAARADFETLYDKPYQNTKCVRVAGPFTVESLSPHRMLGVDEDDELIDGFQEDRAEYSARQSFPQLILENLRTAGVQQAHREDRISFTALTPWPGEGAICAEGRYLEGQEGEMREKRAGIFIGPEFGTVQRSDLVEAARECGEAGFDALIACAFNYEAHATEFSKLGRIPVLKARMNADLHMAADLKNTGKGNLFVIFGEPDISLLPQDDGKLCIKVNGVDVFKPQTGEVISDSTDGIACWFIDTDYNQESFFVRHAYFLGANDPYSALKTTLKAEIDPEAWASLNSDTSRPFEKPKSGRIAVKVINHLGDEVMKVFRV